MKAYIVYNSIDNVINWMKQHMTKWGSHCLNKRTHDMICIMNIFKWDNIYQECALTHKHNTVFIFGICTKYARTNKYFFHIMLTLIPINFKYPTFYMICQNKIFPTLGNHSVIWLTWKHFGQCSKTLNHFFSCQTKLFVSKMNLI